jgi:hypothetical protein
LNIDQRWILLGYGEDGLVQLADGLLLRDNIPEPLKHYVGIAQSLVKACTYDYDLTLVLYLFLGVVFESALRQKYQTVGHLDNDLRKRSLKWLIDWGVNNNYFEEDFFTINAARELRNAWAHSKDPQIAGIAGIGLVRKTIDVINGLFDDRVEQRIERKRVQNEINDRFYELIENGLFLNYLEKRLIIFRMKLLLYNNLVTPHEYYCGFFPLFQIPDNSNSIDIKAPIYIKCNNIIFEKDPALLLTINESTKIEPLVGESNVLRFRDWKEQYIRSKFNLSYITEIHFTEERQRLLSELIYKP